MLTKKESESLYNCLVGLALMPEEIKERIGIFTEKRNIQVGDIYLDGHGIPRLIKKIDHNEKYPVHTVGDRSYTTDGTYDIRDKCRSDLVLDKIYKLVEISGE